MTTHKVRWILISLSITLRPLCFAVLADDGHLPFELSVTVLDEDGALVEGAPVSVIAFLPEAERKDGQAFAKQVKTSSVSGALRFVGTCLDRVFIRANHDRYYTSWMQYRPALHPGDHSRTPRAQTLPIVLKRKINPRPLFAHRVNWQPVPALDCPIGFDLEAADWVDPYGNGVHSDLIFTLSRTLGEGDMYSGTLKIDFSNPMDGIFPIMSTQETNSELLLSRQAPIDGYRSEYCRTLGIRDVDGRPTRVDEPPQSWLDSCEGLWFRIRSEVDETTGELTRARYGKIPGYIDFDVRRPDVAANVNFVYYLSPDDSRSLEFNRKSLVQDADMQGVTKF